MRVAMKRSSLAPRAGAPKARTRTANLQYSLGSPPMYLSVKSTTRSNFYCRPGIREHFIRPCSWQAQPVAQHADLMKSLPSFSNSSLPVSCCRPGRVGHFDTYVTAFLSESASTLIHDLNSQKL